VPGFFFSGWFSKYESRLTADQTPDYARRLSFFDVYRATDAPPMPEVGMQVDVPAVEVAGAAAPRKRKSTSASADQSAKRSSKCMSIRLWMYRF
jgi:hypothetical protein